MTTQSFTVQDVNNEVIDWCMNKVKKRNRSSIEDKDIEPPEKLIRLTSYEDEHKDPSDLLLAYKRIWDNLDVNKPVDAKLEPFVWGKIRYYQQLLKTK